MGGGNVAGVAWFVGVWGWGGPSPTPPKDAAVDAALLRTVTGTADLDVISAAGTSTLHADFTRLTPVAMTPPAFAPIDGSGTSNGTFSIPGVPEGTYYLQLASSYFVLSGDTVDLSFDVLGNTSRGAAT